MDSPNHGNKNLKRTSTADGLNTDSSHKNNQRSSVKKKNKTDWEKKKEKRRQSASSNSSRNSQSEQQTKDETESSNSNSSATEKNEVVKSLKIKEKKKCSIEGKITENTTATNNGVREAQGIATNAFGHEQKEEAGENTDVTDSTTESTVAVTPEYKLPIKTENESFRKLQAEPIQPEDTKQLEGNYSDTLEQTTLHTTILIEGETNKGVENSEGIEMTTTDVDGNKNEALLPQTNSPDTISISSNPIKSYSSVVKGEAAAKIDTVKESKSLNPQTGTEMLITTDEVVSSEYTTSSSTETRTVYTNILDAGFKNDDKYISHSQSGSLESMSNSDSLSTHSSIVIEETEELVEKSDIQNRNSPSSYEILVPTEKVHVEINQIIPDSKEIEPENTITSSNCWVENEKKSSLLPDISSQRSSFQSNKNIDEAGEMTATWNFEKEPQSEYQPKSSKEIVSTAEYPLLYKFFSDLSLGKRRGIEGRNNSCYLDSTLFSLFYSTNIFDKALLTESESEVTLTNDVRSSLKEIVDPLRRNYFCPSHKVIKLRKAMSSINPKLMGSFMDAEEFIFILLEKLNAREFIHYTNEVSDFMHQIIIDNPDPNRYTTVQELFETSMRITDNLQFTCTPRPALLLEMPRSDRVLKGCKGIVPNLQLDISNLLATELENSPITSTLQTFSVPIVTNSRSTTKELPTKTKSCFSCLPLSSWIFNGFNFILSCVQNGVIYTMMGLEDGIHPFPLPLMDIAMQWNPNDLISESSTLTILPDVECGPSQNTPVPTVLMHLLAVICIKGVHYTSFVRCGEDDLAPWIYFDSMAGGTSEVREVKDCGEWLTNLAKDPDEIRQNWPKIPANIKPIISDGHICIYKPSDEQTEITSLIHENECFRKQ